MPVNDVVVVIDKALIRKHSPTGGIISLCVFVATFVIADMSSVWKEVEGKKMHMTTNGVINGIICSILFIFSLMKGHSQIKILMHVKEVMRKSIEYRK
jgi:hypothetical protein